MTDNETTREKTFSEELPYFKERIKEVFDNYDNPNGYEDPLYIAVLHDSKHIVRKAEEEITRQQTEIERLQADNKNLENVIKNTFLEKAGLDIDPLAEVKTEAIKKFAEKLNEKAQIADCFNSYNMVVGTYFIDDLLKEMVGDNNA